MKKFLERLNKVSYYKPSDFDKEECNKSEREKFIEYLELINQDKAKLLLRGTKIEYLKFKLGTKLNSNNILFDGLFLVGDKAKNYLEKVEDIPHPIRVIDSVGVDVCNWIFEEYSNLPIEKIKTDYFKNDINLIKFVNAIKDDRSLIDYYLVGLHKWNSDILVNFVSTTTSFDQALSHENDIIILLWLAESYSNHGIGESTLTAKLKKISTKGLPHFVDFFESEYEYSFKGFILPHFILGALSVSENIFIVNPALLENVNMNWIENGFEINDERFFEFIKTTKYKRFLTLYDNEVFKEKNICNRVGSSASSH